MPESIQLSESGHSVTLKPFYTHRMECAFKDGLTKGMRLNSKGSEVIVEDIQADALDNAVTGLLALLIERITKDGQDVPFSNDWLLDLPERDYADLRDKALSIREKNEDRKGEGKKNR